MLFDWKMILKRRKTSLPEYAYRTRSKTIGELNGRLQNIGASVPPEKELIQMASEPKPENCSEDSWLFFKNLVLPQKQSVQPTQPAPETKNVRKRKTKKPRSSSKKTLSSS